MQKWAAMTVFLTITGEVSLLDFKSEGELNCNNLIERESTEYSLSATAATRLIHRSWKQTAQNISDWISLSRSLLPYEYLLMTLSKVIYPEIVK